LTNEGFNIKTVEELKIKKILKEMKKEVFYEIIFLFDHHQLLYMNISCDPLQSTY